MNTNYTDWILKEIKEVTLTYKDRVAGSESAKGSQLYLSSLLKDWSDQVRLEPFSLSPHAFIGSIPLQAALALAGAVCYLLSGLSRVLIALCLALFVITFLSMIFEYVLYYPAFDFLYPKATGHNVYAERKASGQTRRRIILCGHTDAAFEMPMFEWRNPPVFYGLIILAYGCAFAVPILCIIALCHAGYTPPLALRIVMMVLCCSFVPFLGFARWHVIAPGANDNMSGCLIGMSILKELEAEDIRFAHTDVCCLLTDGEESGLRGAAAFAKAHQKELSEVETYVIAVDTIHDLDQLNIYQRGINWTQANSPEVCALLKEAGKNCGIDLPLTTFYPGACDAEAFSRRKIKAAGLCAIDHVPGNYYHSRYDTWDNMVPEAISAARAVVKEAVRLFADRQEL